MKTANIIVLPPPRPVKRERTLADIRADLERDLRDMAELRKRLGIPAPRKEVENAD